MLASSTKKIRYEGAMLTKQREKVVRLTMAEQYEVAELMLAEKMVQVFDDFTYKYNWIKANIPAKLISSYGILPITVAHINGCMDTYCFVTSKKGEKSIVIEKDPKMDELHQMNEDLVNERNSQREYVKALEDAMEWINGKSKVDNIKRHVGGAKKGLQGTLHLPNGNEGKRS